MGSVFEKVTVSAGLVASLRMVPDRAAVVRPICNNRLVEEAAAPPLMYRSLPPSSVMLTAPGEAPVALPSEEAVPKSARRVTARVPPVTTIFEKPGSVLLPVPLIDKVPVPPLVKVVVATGVVPAVTGESKLPLKVTVVEPATFTVRLVVPVARVRLLEKVRLPVPVVSPKVMAPPPVLRLNDLEENEMAELPVAANTVLVDVLLLAMVAFAPAPEAELTRVVPAFTVKLPEKVLAPLRMRVPPPVLVMANDPVIGRLMVSVPVPLWAMAKSAPRTTFP